MGLNFTNQTIKSIIQESVLEITMFSLLKVVLKMGQTNEWMDWFKLHDDLKNEII